jgi:hypothetical protein
MKMSSIGTTSLMAAVTSRNVPASRTKVESATQAAQPVTADPVAPEPKAVVRPTNNSARDSASQPEPEGSSVATEFRAIQIKPSPPQSPAAPLVAVAERAPSRQSRITIGKVDVQVNNQRHPRSIVPNRKPSGGPRSNFFEARYLSRFPLRP